MGDEKRAEKNTEKKDLKASETEKMQEPKPAKTDEKKRDEKEKAAKGGDEKRAEEKDLQARAVAYEETQRAKYEKMSNAQLEKASKNARKHPQFREFMVDLIGNDRALQKEFLHEFGTIEPVEELVCFDSFFWHKLEKASETEKTKEPKPKGEQVTKADTEQTKKREIAGDNNISKKTKTAPDVTEHGDDKKRVAQSQSVEEQPKKRRTSSQERPERGASLKRREADDDRKPIKRLKHVPLDSATPEQNQWHADAEAGKPASAAAPAANAVAKGGEEKGAEKETEKKELKASETEKTKEPEPEKTDEKKSDEEENGGDGKRAENLQTRMVASPQTASPAGLTSSVHKNSLNQEELQRATSKD